MVPNKGGVFPLRGSGLLQLKLLSGKLTLTFKESPSYSSYTLRYVFSKPFFTNLTDRR